MIVFWISAALVSAIAGALIVHRAARALRPAGAENASVAVYRRQLAEIDDLAERGVLPEAERRSAHAEAARRLLAAADETAEPLKPPTRAGRIAVAAVAGLAPLVAIGVYLFIGSPQLPDQPFARRLAVWRADPSGLDDQQWVAVLQKIIIEHPRDARAYLFLARAQLSTGDPFSAMQTLRAGINVDRRRGDLWEALGVAEMARANGQITPDAIKDYQQASQLDPTMPGPRYYIGRAKLLNGDIAGGLADWRALDKILSPEDWRRRGLEQEIASVEKTGALPPPAPEPAAAAQGQQGFIRAMVDKLAGELQAHPDDPPGWARLIRSYQVLGDTQGRDAALAKVRDIFKNRPDDIKLIQDLASRPQP
jgi:cytochrome c-type biogenesis protein CcmH